MIKKKIPVCYRNLFYECIWEDTERQLPLSRISYRYSPKESDLNFTPPSFSTLSAEYFR